MARVLLVGHGIEGVSTGGELVCYWIRLSIRVAIKVPLTKDVVVCVVLLPDQMAKNLFCLGGQVPESIGVRTMLFLVSRVNQHLNTLRELKFQPLIEEEGILVKVPSLDRLNLKQVEISKCESTHKVNGNHIPTRN